MRGVGHVICTLDAPDPRAVDGMYTVEAPQLPRSSLTYVAVLYLVECPVCSASGVGCNLCTTHNSTDCNRVCRVTLEGGGEKCSDDCLITLRIGLCILGGEGGRGDPACRAFFCAYFFCPRLYFEAELWCESRSQNCCKTVAVSMAVSETYSAPAGFLRDRS